MAIQQLGTLKTPRGRTYRVKWDDDTRRVYVTPTGAHRDPGWLGCAGRAPSARQALEVASAELRLAALARRRGTARVAPPASGHSMPGAH